MVTSLNLVHSHVVLLTDGAFKYFTLPNARRFYLSVGKLLVNNGLNFASSFIYHLFADTEVNLTLSSLCPRAAVVSTTSRGHKTQCFPRCQQINVLLCSWRQRSNLTDILFRLKLKR